MDASGNSITAGFSLGSPSADALGFGSDQLANIAAMAVAPVQQAVPYAAPLATHNAFTQPAIQSGPTKLFVGSIPGGTTQEMIKEEFGKYGAVAEVFIKNDNDMTGRMWGFVTFVNPASSLAAVNALNEQMPFPNAQRPLAVSFAKGGGGQGYAAPAPAAGVGLGQPSKLFIGSIPAGTTKEQLTEEFGKFGAVMDVFLKNDSSDPLRMWGFITYDNASAAANAVTSLHERLVLPGGSRPCAVSFAKNSQAQHSMAAQNMATAAINPVAGATKLFIGTIPVGTTEAHLRAEFEKYGQVTEIFLKSDQSDPGRLWGFLSYAEPQSAAVAVSALHEKLMMPGSTRPLAVSFAKNAGRGGTGGPQSQISPQLALGNAPIPPPPPLLGADGTSCWKVYYNATGLPYYHNTLTGITQWECPPEFPGGPAAVLSDPASVANIAPGSVYTQPAATSSLGLGSPYGMPQTSAGFSAVAPLSDAQRYSPF